MSGLNFKEFTPCLLSLKKRGEIKGVSYDSERFFRNIINKKYKGFIFSFLLQIYNPHYPLINRLSI